MEPTIVPYNRPNDDAIAQAQKKLDFVFPESYIQFIKSGYPVGESLLEPLMIDPISTHLDIYDAANNAWENYEIPREWLPICDDNADLFLINAEGTVRFWSHDGMFQEETWPTLGAWLESISEG
jgi:hypothetical protein